MDGRADGRQAGRVTHSRSAAARVALLVALGWWLAGCIGPGLEPPGRDDSGGGLNTMISRPSDPGSTGDGADPDDGLGNPNAMQPGNAGTGGTAGSMGAPTVMPPQDGTPGSEPDPTAPPPAVCSGPRVTLVAQQPLEDPDGGLASADAGPPDGVVADGGALDCEIELPTEGLDFDPGNSSFERVDGDGALPVPVVGAAAGCAVPGHGVYFADPTMPTLITLCPETCQAVAEGAGLSLVLGCQ